MPIGVATPFVASWKPSAKAKAAGAPVKVDISKILPGEQIRASGEASQSLYFVVPQKCLRA